MRRSLTLLLCLALLGCSPRPQPPAAQPTESNPVAQTPPAQLAPPVLPPPTVYPTKAGASPDGRWQTAIEGNKFVVRPTAGGESRVIALEGLNRNLWTPWSTLLYYKENQDVWLEADPATGESKPFWPDYLKPLAGNLAFSADGSRLLYTTPICLFCNQPVYWTQTSYVIDLKSGTRTEVGVDREVQWDGNQLVLDASRVPGLSYYPYWARRQTPIDLPVPAVLNTLGIATPYAEWRVYDAGTPDGSKPLAVYPGGGGILDFPTIVLPDLPDKSRLRLELWAEVYPGVPEKPNWGTPRSEGGRRWLVVMSVEVNGNPKPYAGERALLHQIRMDDALTGWGQQINGPILRTSDGGATWRDVTPAGLAAFFGQSQVKRVDDFGPGGNATVALAHWTVTADNHWSAETGQITVFHTSDGGATWGSSLIETGSRLAAPNGISFSDQAHGYLSAAANSLAGQAVNLLYRTADGGRTWTAVRQVGDGLPGSGAIRFVTPLLGWLARGSDHRLFQTEDGGATWSESPLTSDGLVLRQLPTFLTAAEGYVVVAYGDKVTAYWTEDDGRTWNKRFDLLTESSQLFLVSSSDAYTWKPGQGDVRWTHDGGQTWATPPGDHDAFAQVCFISPREGWALQANGLLAHTADGGATWTPVDAAIVR